MPRQFNNAPIRCDSVTPLTEKIKLRSGHVAEEFAVGQIQHPNRHKVVLLLVTETGDSGSVIHLIGKRCGITLSKKLAMT